MSLLRRGRAPGRWLPPVPPLHSSRICCAHGRNEDFLNSATKFIGFDTYTGLVTYCSRTPTVAMEICIYSFPIFHRKIFLKDIVGKLTTCLQFSRRNFENISLFS